MADTDIATFASEGNRDLHILFGSQSGNSEGLAEKWQKEAPRYGLNPTIHDMDGFDIKSMSEMTRVMIVCSTWGEGEMPDNAEELYQEALNLNMSIIIEVHTVEEAKQSLKFKDALIGINNRNLKTLKTDLNTTYDIHDVLINHNGPLISESGIKSKDDLLQLSNKTTIKTFLIGESILKDLHNNSIFSVL